MEKNAHSPPSTSQLCADRSRLESTGVGSGSVPALSSTSSETVQSVSEQVVTPRGDSILSDSYSDPVLDDALHELLGGGTCSGDDKGVADDTTGPSAFDLWHYFFPPLVSQPAQLPSSQTSSVPGAFQSTQSHHPSVDRQPNSDREIEIDYLFDLFNLIPLNQNTELQGASLCTDTLTTHSSSLTTQQQPSVDSNTTLVPQPTNSNTDSSHVLHSSDNMHSQDTMTTDDTSFSSIIDGLSLFPFPLSFSSYDSTDDVPRSHELTQSNTLQRSLPTARLQLTGSALPMDNSCLPQSSTTNTSSQLPTHTNLNENASSEIDYLFDLFPFPLFPAIDKFTDLPSQNESQPIPIEQETELQSPSSSTALPSHFPSDNVTTQKEKGSLSLQHSHASSIHDVGINHDCEPSSRSPANTHSKTIEIEESMCSEISSQMDADISVSSQSSKNKKQKLEEDVPVSQEQRQRKLNNVSALRYRKKRKEMASGLELRMEQLGAENTRLKDQVSALTFEIDKMKQLIQLKSQNRRQYPKVCLFFHHSTCIANHQL